MYVWSVEKWPRSAGFRVQGSTGCCMSSQDSSVYVRNPRGSIYTTSMELGPKRPFLSWLWGSNSIMVVYMDPLGISFMRWSILQSTASWDLQIGAICSFRRSARFTKVVRGNFDLYMTTFRETQQFDTC